MEEEQCFSCVICDFMTYSSLNLEHHFKLRHDGMSTKSVLKLLPEPLCTIIKQMDEFMLNSNLFAAKRHLADSRKKPAVTSVVKNEPLVIMQSSSGTVPDFGNDLNDEESKPCLTELFNSPPVDETHSAISHIKPDPDCVKEEISTLLLAPYDLSSIASGYEDLEVDIAGKPFLDVDTLFSMETNTDEGKENTTEERDRPRDLTSKINVRPDISESASICWVCFGKFVRCVGAERSLFLKHSNSFCPYARNDHEDAPVDQKQIRLLCPKNCKFVTSDASAFCEHVPVCLKSESHTKGNDLIEVQRRNVPLPSQWIVVRIHQ